MLHLLPPKNPWRYDSRPIPSHSHGRWLYKQQDLRLPLLCALITWTKYVVRISARYKMINGKRRYDNGEENFRKYPTYTVSGQFHDCPLQEPLAICSLPIDSNSSKFRVLFNQSSGVVMMLIARTRVQSAAQFWRNQSSLTYFASYEISNYR
jgi:hypothetical protein